MSYKFVAPYNFSWLLENGEYLNTAIVLIIFYCEEDNTIQRLFIRVQFPKIKLSEGEDKIREIVNNECKNRIDSIVNDYPEFAVLHTDLISLGVEKDGQHEKVHTISYLLSEVCSLE